MRSAEFLFGLATAMVSEAGLGSGCLTFNFNLGFFAGGSPAGGVAVDFAFALDMVGVEFAEALFARGT